MLHEVTCHAIFAPGFEQSLPLLNIRIILLLVWSELVDPFRINCLIASIYNLALIYS